MKARIILNPFTRETVFSFIVSNVTFEKTIFYQEIDEWHEVEVANTWVFIHFCYDEKMGVSIYPLIDAEEDSFSERYDYSTCLPIELKITLEESEMLWDDKDFHVKLNPFTKRALFLYFVDGVWFEQTLFINEFDEWQVLEVADDEFFVHFDYDQEMTVCAYPLVDRDKDDFDQRYDLSGSVDLKLTIVLNEF